MSNKDDATITLAKFHYQTQPGITDIFRLTTPGSGREDLQTEPIKLLGVNPDTVPTGITPLAFPPIPASGVYPSIVVEVTPDEFARLKNGELSLPNSWELSTTPLPKS